MRIPTEIHKVLVGACDIESPEYLMLKNGVIGFEGEDEGKVAVVTILCEPERATEFIAWVKQVRPSVAHLITVSPPRSA